MSNKKLMVLSLIIQAASAIAVGVIEITCNKNDIKEAVNEYLSKESR